MESRRVSPEEINDWLSQRIAAILECPTAEIEADVPFPSLGLDSLSLLTLTGDLANWLGRDLAAPLLVGYPTVESLSRHLAEDQDADDSASIPRAPRDQPLPLTFSQARILGYSKMGPEGDSNLIGRRYILKGKLSVPALQWAFNKLICRHEVLRTTFGLQDGEGVQIIHAPQPLTIEITDLSKEPQAENKAQEMAAAVAATTAMDLQKGPLLRAVLLKMPGDEYRLIVLIHHMACDAEALTIFCEDLETFYAAFTRGEKSPLPELPLQAADIGAWQRDWLRKDGEAYQNRLTWWMQHWEGHIPAPLELPFRRKSPPASPPHPADCGFNSAIGPAIVEQIRRLAHSEGATSYVAFLAAFAVVLHRLTGEVDLVIGTYVSDRSRTDTRRMMGVFINMLPIRVRLHGLTTFRELLLRMRDVVEQATRHRELPLEDLRHSLTAAGKPAPEVRVIFQLVPKAKHALDLPGLEVDVWSLAARAMTMPWGFTMNLVTKGSFEAQVSCDGNLYDPAGVQALLQDYRELLRKIVADPEMAIRVEARDPAPV